MRRAVLLVAWLVVAWLALWERWSLPTVAGGLAVAVALVALFPPGRAGPDAGRFRPLAAARFLGVFLVKLVEANAIVAWEVLTPTERINEGIVAVPLAGASRGLTAVVANAVTLTPGTLTVDLDEGHGAGEPTVLYVHVLHLRDIESVRRDVQRFEALAIRAFGSDAAVAALGEAP